MTALRLIHLCILDEGVFLQYLLYFPDVNLLHGLPLRVYLGTLEAAP